MSFRVHVENVPEEKIQNFLRDVDEKSLKVLVYRHPKEEAEREHFHGLLIDTRLSTKILREWFVRKLGVDKGNKSYSVGTTYGGSKQIKISEFTYPTYCTYMTKGKYEPVHNKGFTQEEIDGFKSAWKEPKVPGRMDIQVERLEVSKKKSLWACGYEAETRYLRDHEGNEDIDYILLTELVIQVLQEEKILAHEYTVMHILQDIQSRTQTEKYILRIISKVRL